VNHFNAKKFAVTHPASGGSYTLNVRAYDSGISFRYEVEGESAKNISAESTGFVIPAGTRVFSQGGVNVYENSYGGADIAAIT
ncbi:glycoside hydrolase family 97 N-terminal domain-containing protein, partial [Shewanella sp. A25]|nr:glycoside hydrolase family 97 N-terminal domain-containing protein [Shewanella shenzhenensis]